MKKKDYTNPVTINKDAWFYSTSKGFDFVVWVTVGDKREVAHFRLTHKKLKKYM